LEEYHPIINHGLAKSGVDIVKTKTFINDGKMMENDGDIDVDMPMCQVVGCPCFSDAENFAKW
jgi:hypothetical protein